MAQATFSCREAAIHLAGRRSAERKKHAGGMFFSPRKSPISSTILQLLSFDGNCSFFVSSVCIRVRNSFRF